MKQQKWELISKEVKDGNKTNANQHGFMENAVCQTNLIFYLMKLQAWLINVMSVNLIDFCKVFHRVSSDILIKKLGK